VDTLLELNKRAQAKASVLPPLDAQHALRVQAMRDQRKRDSQPLRDYLYRVAAEADKKTHDICTSAEIEFVLHEWDSWAWHVEYPWDLDEHGLPRSYFVIELVQGVAGGQRWIITLSTEIVSVKSFQNGMVKQ
jgi:hypothetical protein